MDATGYLRTLRSRWATLAAGAGLGALGAAVLILTAPPVYETETRFFISTSSSDTATSAYEGNLFSQQRVTSYAELVTDQQVVSAVIDDLGLDTTVEDLSQEIDASVVPNTVILDVTVRDTSPTRAVAVGESLAEQFRIVVSRLETPAGAADPTVTVSVIAAPQLPTTASSPQPARDAATGLILGVLLAAAFVVVRARLDTRVRDIEKAAEDLGTSSLGVVLDDREIAQRKVLAGLSQTPAAESLRQIRNNLDFLDVDSPPRVIVVTSALPGEGKTTLATNLAVQLAEEGRRVVLVDADARRPRASVFLGVPSGAGLTNVLNGSVDLEDVLQEVGTTGFLRVLAAGPAVPNPGNLLSSGRMRALLQTLRDGSDIVVLDSPPVLPVADTSGLAPLTDGVVFCTRWGRSTRTDLQASRRALTRVGARTLGLVVTFVPRSEAGATGYGYGPDEPEPTRKWGLRLRRRRHVQELAPGPSPVGHPPRSALSSTLGNGREGQHTGEPSQGPSTTKADAPPPPSLPRGVADLVPEYAQVAEAPSPASGPSEAADPAANPAGMCPRGGSDDDPAAGDLSRDENDPHARQPKVPGDPAVPVAPETTSPAPTTVADVTLADRNGQAPMQTAALTDVKDPSGAPPSTVVNGRRVNGGTAHDDRGPGNGRRTSADRRQGGKRGNGRRADTADRRGRR